MGEISNLLNAIPGAQKTWSNWRKTWQDLQSKIKMKAANKQKIERGTGGGPPPSPLNDFEEGVVALIHPHAISGHNESEESVVEFEVPVNVVLPSSMFCNDVAELSLPEMTEPQASTSSAPLQASTSTAPQASTSRAPPQAPKRKKKESLQTLLKEKLQLKKDALEEKRRMNTALIESLNRLTSVLEKIVSK